MTHTTRSSLLCKLESYIPREVSDYYRIYRAGFYITGEAVICCKERDIALLQSFLDSDDIQQFLQHMTDFTSKLWNPSFRGKALFIPELDELIRRANPLITSEVRLSCSDDLIVYVATEVYTEGGHTRVIEDMVRAMPEYEHLLITTGMDSGHTTLTKLKSQFDKLHLNVRPLTGLSQTERVRELSSLIHSVRPQAIMVFAHPDDSVAYLGIDAHLAKRTVFIHHADHIPALGASRTDFLHVDLTPVCHSICSRHANLRPLMLNLTVQDAGTVRITNRQPMIGLTCGSAHKYAGSVDFSYAQLLANLFSSGVGQVFHVGEMADSQKSQICAEIAAFGQNPSKLIFLDETPSLALKMIEVAPDFFLTSHPIGGGKATVEAMSVGLPILYICSPSTPPLLRADMALGSSIPVVSLKGLPAAIHRLKAEREDAARRSRQIYEEHYSAPAFMHGLLSIIAQLPGCNERSEPKHA